MKKTSPFPSLLASASCLVLISGTAHGAVITTAGTTGTFDAAGGNDIDLDPTGQLAAFKTTVSTAYGNNQGGVIDWSTNMPGLGTSSTAPGDTFTALDVAYGASGAETLTITFDRSIGLYSNNVAGQVSGLSDTNAVISDGGNDPVGLAFNMSFSGADIAEAGFAMLARATFTGGGLNFRATATFSDTTTSILDYTADDGATDTFLHFAAPSGETITGVFVTWVSDGTTSRANGQRRPVMDDLGFVVVPEPSAAMLLLSGVLGLALRRRR